MDFFSMTKIACVFSAMLFASAGSLAASEPGQGLPSSVVSQNGTINPVLLVQAPVYGARCVTPVGWCPIAPQPVSTPCQCGDAQGITLQ